jgi:hypothetical protein
MKNDERIAYLRTNENKLGLHTPRPTKGVQRAAVWQCGNSAADLKAGLNSVYRRHQSPERKAYHTDMTHVRVVFHVMRKRVKTKKSDDASSKHIHE